MGGGFLSSNKHVLHVVQTDPHVVQTFATLMRELVAF